MKFCVPYLSSLSQASQSSYGYGHRWKCLYSLSLGLILFALPAATIAFESLYSDPTECGSFRTTWAWSDTKSGPPFLLLILPFGARPTIIQLPDSCYNNTTRTGSYIIDKLKMKRGTEFIISMLYGEGALFSGLIQFKALTLPFFNPST